MQIKPMKIAVEAVLLWFLLGIWPAAAGFKSPESLIRAKLSVADGDVDAAARAADDAIALARRIGASWWVARGLRIGSG